MGTENIVYVSSSESSLYQLQVLEHDSRREMTSSVFKAVQADISRNTTLANTILLKYISDATVFSAEDLKSLCELLKLAIITSLDSHPQAAMSYTEAATDCVKQMKRRGNTKGLKVANS